MTMLERGLELVASRLGRLDRSGYQQGTDNARGRFKANTFEPDGAGEGSAWCVLDGVEPTSRTGKDALYVSVVLLFKRAPLATSLRAIHRLMSPDNPFGLLALLQTPRLNEREYAGVTWVGDDWLADAYAPPPGAVQELTDQINTANRGYTFTVDVVAMEAIRPEEKEFAPFVAMRAAMEIRPIYVAGR